MNFARVPKIRQVILELKHKAGCDDRRFIILEMALLQLLTGKKPEAIFTGRPIPLLEARRGQCIGTRLVLKKREEIRDFLTKTCICVLGRDEEFTGLSSSKAASFATGRFSFDIKNVLLYPETEPFYDIFETIPSIGVTVVTNAKSYHVACDPERLPLSDYCWLQREGLSLKKLEHQMAKKERQKTKEIADVQQRG